MTTLPIPVVVALLLLLLAVSNHHELLETATGRVFAWVLYLHALSMMLIGARWSWDLIMVVPVVAILSVVNSALLYFAFRSLGQPGPVFGFSRDGWHLLLVLVVALNALLLPGWIDVSMIFAKILYIVLLIRLAKGAPETLQFVRLGWLKNTQLALWAALASLATGVVVDLAITLDFILYEGRHAASLVGGVSLIVLLLLGWASVLSARGRVEDDQNPDISENFPVTNRKSTGNHTDRQALSHGTDERAQNHDELALIKTLDTLLVDNRLYADTELNLQRLARKAGVPARTISRTINAQTGMNMSQWVNKARIEAVCQLLESSDMTINRAMLEAGFMTKSNFNREFQRIKGCSPTTWRQQS